MRKFFILFYIVECKIFNDYLEKLTNISEAYSKGSWEPEWWKKIQAKYSQWNVNKYLTV